MRSPTSPADCIPRGLTGNRRRVLEVAMAEVGTRERSGKNDGPVEKYVPQWARGRELPWCAWFVGWVWEIAIGSYLYGRHWGGAWDLFREAAVAGQLLEHDPAPATQPQPGDIFVTLHRSTTHRGPGHVGFVLRTSDDGSRVNTVEGNYRNSVAVVTRPTASFAGVIHPYADIADRVVDYDTGLIDAPLVLGVADTR